ncbi:MAG: alpha/beta fold hydrolase [Nitrosomonadales bacterium]|nr:alpha/beta fold hydrolase [Nitrosomonadales bacterium]
MMTDKAETVILIHGLWMHGLVMLLHQRWLRAEGYAVRRFSYPSWRGGLADNAHSLSGFIHETPGEIIHLVAHSLGGQVALKMLSQEPDARIRRVVLLGTPYAGCHCGLTLSALPVLTALVGRTFKEWFSLPRPVLPPTVEVGIIAGTRPIGLGRLIPGLPHPNDGLITVDETRIAAAKDRMVLGVSHSGMLVSRACVLQIASFLKKGRFNHA